MGERLNLLLNNILPFIPDNLWCIWFYIFHSLTSQLYS